MPAGHVYAVHGDLLRIAADAVLIPCDASKHVGSHWGRLTPRPGHHVTPSQLRWAQDKPRVTEAITLDTCIVRYVDTGATPRTADIDWLREGLRQALDALKADLAGRTARNNRDRPLIALPLAGTGAGGFAHVRGQALRALLDEARAAAADSPADIVIVARSRADYTALQSRRSDDDWGDLDPAQRAEADRLAQHLADGQLVLFLGAGVSRSAGLPDFAELLQHFAADAPRPDTPPDVPVDLPGQAGLLTQGLTCQQIQQTVARALMADRHGVAHALLTSLRVPEAVTTNFDNLYELAAAVPFDDALQVVPWQRTPGRQPWLLKAHGDAGRGSLVLTASQYETYQDDHGPVAGVIQSLFLLSRHVLFIGYSMRDTNILGLIDQVSELLDSNAAAHQRFGTVLSIDPAPQQDDAVDPRLPTLHIGATGEALPSAARHLETFLDRVAWQSARHETAWLLDPTYVALVDPQDHTTVEALQNLHLPDRPEFAPLRDALVRLGHLTPGTP